MTDDARVKNIVVFVAWLGNRRRCVITVTIVRSRQMYIRNIVHAYGIGNSRFSPKINNDNSVFRCFQYLFEIEYFYILNKITMNFVLCICFNGFMCQK